MGLTDIELANGLDFDDTYDDDRTYEMEYEVCTLSFTFNVHIYVIGVYGISVYERDCYVCLRRILRRGWGE